MKNNLFNSATQLSKQILFFLLVVSFAAGLAAQNEGRKRPFVERAEAQRVAYMTQVLDLSSTEAEKFWPLYNAYKKEEMSIRRSQNHSRRNADDIRKLSDIEANQLITHMLQTDEKLLKLKQNYYQKFQVVLPPQKVALIPEAERGFREEVVRRVSEGPNQRRRWRD